MTAQEMEDRRNGVRPTEKSKSAKKRKKKEQEEAQERQNALEQYWLDKHNENNPVCEQQKKLMKNIDELNAISEKVGIPKIRLEVKNISATRELGVD